MYDYDDDCDYEPRKGYIDSISRIVENEVNNRLTDKQKQLEKDYEYYKDQMWEAKNKLSKIQHRLATHEKEVEKISREAVKTAQREYYFDCAIGDKVYIVNWKRVYPKCDKCNDNRSVKVLIDAVEVNAECPVCGTSAKRDKLYHKEYFISEGTVSRLQIELTKDQKWIKVWTDNDNDKYDLNYHELYRTREEAEKKLAEILSEEKNKQK